jgi:hypothetical protein
MTALSRIEALPFWKSRCRVQLRHGEASPDLPDYAERCAARVARMLA